MPDSQIPFSQPVRKPILLYLIIGLILISSILVAFWQGYRLYRTKHPPTRLGVYACSPDGQCLLYPEQATAELCPITFLTETCNSQCDKPLNRCKK